MTTTSLPPAYIRTLDAGNSPQHSGISPSPFVPPDYSPDPLEDEETLTFTPRMHSHSSSPQGHFTRQWPQATLILKDQDPETRLPTYGKGGRIVGELGLTNPEKVERVTIKLFGEMSLSVADSGASSTALVSDTYLLWQNPATNQSKKTGGSTTQQESTDNSRRRSGMFGTPATAPGASSPSESIPASLSSSNTPSTPNSSGSGASGYFDPDTRMHVQNASHQSKCPSILPVSIQFPIMYHLHGRNWRLPPSFEATFLGIPALFVRCMYTLSVTITRTRSYRLASWTSSKTYITMVNFRPRTRPHQPIVVQDTVYASIKPSPEDWTQVVTTMPTRSHRGSLEGIRPIECHLFVPSTQTFALTEAIPFHLQLHSSLRSFRELFPANSALLTPYPDGEGFQPIEGRVLQGDKSISITIARQVVVEINGRRRFRTFLAGVGKMRPVAPLMEAPSSAYLSEEAGSHRPPHALRPEKRASVFVGEGAPHLTSDGVREEEAEVTLDWAGEVVTFAEITAGGFSASNLIVKDFLVLSLTPPNPRSSPLAALQFSHPIRLVTDAWIDTDVLHPGDR